MTPAFRLSLRCALVFNCALAIAGEPSPLPALAATPDEVPIHAFRANIPQAAVDDMRRRLANS